MTEFSNQTDTYRNEIVIKLNKQLDNIVISRNIEKNVYNYTIDLAKKKGIKRLWSNEIFRELYLSKIRSIYSNIDENSYVNNKNFKQNILDNKIDIDNISTLSMYDIFPENWSYLIEKKTKIDKIKLEFKPEAMTDQFKCRKCGSRSTSYYEVQTRSADEPMTQFINCLTCGNRWKQ